MTPKQRMINAFEHRKPIGVVPAWDIEFHPTEKFFGKSYIMGERLANLSPKEKEKAYYHNAELFVEIAERFDQSAIAIPPPYWETAYLWLPTWEDEVSTVRTLKEVCGDTYLLIGNADGVFGIPNGADMTNFIYWLYDSPDEVKKTAEDILKNGIERGRKFADLGIDAIFMGSDLCFNKGPFLSPALFAEFVTPYLARIIEEFKRAGVYSIKHTDGDIMPILDQLIQCGPTAIHSLESSAGVDIQDVKQAVDGRICLIGNVDCRALQTGTAEDVYQSASYALTHGMPGGGYVFSCSNVILADVPPSNYLAMVQARQDIGRYV